MPITNDLLETINSAITAGGGYTTYTPESWTTSTTAAPFYASTTFTPNTIYMSNSNIDEKISEYTEKVDKHVDQLEEDIEFLNNEREDQSQAIVDLINDNVEKERRISNLELKVNHLESLLSETINKLTELEVKVNGIS